jgi:hypothetical protein
MAVAGDPFRTPEFDELRALQRRQLRYVPVSLLERYQLDALPGAGEPDGFDEDVVRDLADQEARNLVELFENFEIHARVERQAAFLYERSGSEAGIDDFQATLVDLATLLAATQTSLFTASIDDDRAARLERFVKLVIWADELADDGYVDDRLAPLMTRPAAPGPYGAATNTPSRTESPANGPTDNGSESPQAAIDPEASTT